MRGRDKRAAWGRFREAIEKNRLREFQDKFQLRDCFLSKHGREEQAAKVSVSSAEDGFHIPELIIVSPMRRTLQTLAGFLDQLVDNVEAVNTQRQLATEVAGHNHSITQATSSKTSNHVTSSKTSSSGKVSSTGNPANPAGSSSDGFLKRMSRSLCNITAGMCGFGIGKLDRERVKERDAEQQKNKHKESDENQKDHLQKAPTPDLQEENKIPTFKKLQLPTIVIHPGLTELSGDSHTDLTALENTAKPFHQTRKVQELQNIFNTNTSKFLKAGGKLDWRLVNEKIKDKENSSSLATCSSSPATCSFPAATDSSGKIAETCPPMAAIDPFLQRSTYEKGQYWEMHPGVNLVRVKGREFHPQYSVLEQVRRFIASRPEQFILLISHHDVIKNLLLQGAMAAAGSASPASTPAGFALATSAPPAHTAGEHLEDKGLPVLANIPNIANAVPTNAIMKRYSGGPEGKRLGITLA